MALTTVLLTVPVVAIYFLTYDHNAPFLCPFRSNAHVSPRLNSRLARARVHADLQPVDLRKHSQIALKKHSPRATRQSLPLPTSPSSLLPQNPSLLLRPQTDDLSRPAVSHSLAISILHK